jgi:hypothetical protein
MIFLQNLLLLLNGNKTTQCVDINFYLNENTEGVSTFKNAIITLSAWTKLFSMNFDKVKELCQSQKPS